MASAPMRTHTSSTKALTPSKRSADNEAEDLYELLSVCKEVLCDPNLESPFRRTLLTATHKALTEAAKKAKAIRSGEMQVIAHQGIFERKTGHDYKPRYSPARKKSAAERSSTSTARQQARVAAQLAVGQGQMQASDFQKAQNDRRKLHALRDRSQRIQQTLDKKPTSDSSAKRVD
jgi:hypothetical protein